MNHQNYVTSERDWREVKTRLFLTDAGKRGFELVAISLYGGDSGWTLRQNPRETLGFLDLVNLGRMKVQYRILRCCVL